MIRFQELYRLGLNLHNDGILVCDIAAARSWTSPAAFSRTFAGLIHVPHLCPIIASGSDNFGLRGDTRAALDWGPCDPAVIQDPTISCSFFEIPLDYHDLHAGTGHIAVAKVNATGKRLGTVFINPGGPGESGLAALDEASDLLVALTGGQYDIVSWDPRGIGNLTFPGDIFCFSSLDEYNAFWNDTIELDGIEYTGNFTDPADIDALLSQAALMQHKYEELGKRCQSHPTGQYLKYVGTAATVRDMVALADVLDGPGSPVNYIGLSYGTVLGAWFVNLFPERVGRVILDGVLDPTLIATEETTTIWPQQLADTDKVYEAFVTGCALAGPEGCPIASPNASASDVDATIQALLQDARDAARKDASAPVTSADIRQGLLSAMYFPEEWAELANTTYPKILAAVQAGLGGLTRRILQQSGGNSTRSYSGTAIACSDSVDRRGTTMEDVFKDLVTATQNADPGSHKFSAAWPATFNYCPFWPVRAVERYQGPFNKKFANKVLVVSNLLDPATPLKGAQALIELLGDSATLIVQEGFGHTSISSPSQCMNGIMNTYLLKGTLPDGNGTTCGVNGDFDIFDGVSTEDILAALAP
ncbi:hypothetical protein VTO73DRAFT_4498 [Trametes versicolor]